ncbi:hypothetical protein IKG48_01530 [Candidatus Saccharibacteria bacterium]|nr:hypothetical protein [Candidatus Saccharibacteria bacterium]
MEKEVKSPNEVVVESETVVQPAEPKPKKRVGLTIMLVVLVLLLVGGALALGYLWGKNNNQSQDSNSTNNSSSKEDQKAPLTEQEAELTDETLKKDINQKVAYLNWVDSVADNATKLIEKMAGYNSPFEQIYTNSMDDDRKLETAFYSLSSNFTPVHINMTPEKYAVAKSLIEQDREKYGGMISPNESIENAISQNITTIDADIVAQRYYDLFGEELNPRTISAPAICSNVYYSQDTNSYLRFPFMCGGTSAGKDIILQEKITEQDGNIFVYYRAASEIPDLIANDFSFQERRTAVSGIDASRDIATSLAKDMESNPSKYAEYRLVFEKNDKGTYSFKRAEKIQ